MHAKTSEILEVRTKTFGAAVGMCIYCGATCGLTDEHVLPFGLGGNFVLPASSCIECNKITSAFEGKVLGGFMLEARTAGRFPTRRPKKRPYTLPIKAKRGEQLESIALPAAESPGILQLPILDRAAFLVGRAPVSGTTLVGVETLRFGKELDEVATTLRADAIETTVNVDATAFARMLAKIGYAFTVATCGPYPLNEVPVLPLILGIADDCGTWVGSNNYRLLVDAKLPQHGLGLVSLRATVDKHTEEILVARVKLFASTGATGYEVVVRRRPIP